MSDVHLPAIAGRLAKRAVEGVMLSDGDVEKNPLYNTSRAGMAIMALSIIVFAVILIAIRYTLWGVVATLAYVEKEQADVALNPPAYAEDEAAESTTVKPVAITSKIRRTVGHLQSGGGFWARWRGLGCAIGYQVAFIALSGALTGILKGITFGYLPYLDQLVGSMIASLALAHVLTTWTHIVISDPSPKRWFRRIPAWRKTLKNVWLATAVHELAARLAVVIPLAMFYSMDLMTSQNLGAVIGKAIAIAVVGLILSITLVIPSGVTLTRVQASMLPEEDETIVPFDRSFGGKVEPAIVGGSGAISFVDAWKTFDRQARARVVKLCVKIVLVEIALHIVFGAVLAGEFLAFTKQAKPE